MNLAPDRGLDGGELGDALLTKIAAFSAEGKIYRKCAVVSGSVSVILFLLGLLPAFRSVMQ